MTETPLRSSLDCPHCGRPIGDGLITRAAGRIASAARKSFGAGPGRGKKLAPCPKCGAMLGARERRKHKC